MCIRDRNGTAHLKTHLKWSERKTIHWGGGIYVRISSTRCQYIFWLGFSIPPPPSGSQNKLAYLFFFRVPWVRSIWCKTRSAWDVRFRLIWQETVFLRFSHKSTATAHLRRLLSLSPSLCFPWLSGVVTSWSLLVTSKSRRIQASSSIKPKIPSDANIHAVFES